MGDERNSEGGDERKDLGGEHFSVVWQGEGKRKEQERQAAQVSRNPFDTSLFPL